MTLAPIVLFAYNRPDHVSRTLEALAANNLAGESQLIIYADGPKPTATEEDKKKIALTRQAIRAKKWCGAVEIIESAVNKGLASSVIQGVTATVNKYGSVIVLEDDLVPAPGFLLYMNTALNRYAAEENVMQLSGYMFPLEMPVPAGQTFFMPFTTSWGWATWKKAWDHFDAEASGYQQLKTDKQLASRFDLDDAYPYSAMLIRQMEGSGIDSWAIRWWWSVFKHRGLTLYPPTSLIQNIGFGQGATHTTGAAGIFQTTGNDIHPDRFSFPQEPKVDPDLFAAIRQFLAAHSGAEPLRPWFKRIFSRR